MSAPDSNTQPTNNFIGRDFILMGEEEEYKRTSTALLRELGAEGVLEQTFAAEVVGATWRLRRCGIIEASLAVAAGIENDPAKIESGLKSVDRARAQANTRLQRSMNELRKLQTERVLRAELNLSVDGALADTKRILGVLKNHHSEPAQPEPEAAAAPGYDDTYAALEALMTANEKAAGLNDWRREMADLDSFCKTAPHDCKSEPDAATEGSPDHTGGRNNPEID